MPNIKATDLGLTLSGRRIFSNLNFKVQQGEGLVILGPNGSGKTLLLRLLSGTLKPSSGQLFKDRHFSRQQYCDFDSRVDEHLTASQYFHCWGNWSKREDALALWGLEPIWKTPLRKLSLGQKGRVQLASALSHQPALLLLDEPDLGLDSETTTVIIEALKSIPSTCTTFLTSHHQSLYQDLLWPTLFLGGPS